MKAKSSWSVVSFHSSPKRLKIFIARAYAISRSLPISRGKAVGTPDYDGSMGLALVVGPAKAGKIARLLEGYLEQIDRDPVLIVPNRSDVERIERDLLARAGALLAGSIGTFDDVFRELALADPDARTVASDAQRALVARRALARTPLNGLGRSSRFAGFADSLLAVLAELESGLLDPEQLDGDLAQLYASYRAELDRLGLWDRDLLRRRAVERLRSELEAWDGRPVFAYGFEDLTGAEWGLLEALTARAQVTVSLPYEPARAAFASLRRTQEDLASLAAGAIEDLPARSAEYGHAALAHLERHLFADMPPHGPPLDGAIRFFEGAGARGSLELVAEDVRELAAAGVPLHEIALVVPSVERWRAPLETVLGTLAIPFAIEGRVRLGQTAFGQALVSLLRFEWQLGGRRELYAFLRSPYSGFLRSNVDFLEGRLRGRGVAARESVEEETIRLRDGQPLPPLEALRGASGPVAAARAIAAAMLRSAHGLDAPPVGDASRADLRSFESLTRVLDELDGWSSLGGDLSADDVLGALDHAEVRLGSAGERGRVAVLDLARARTRRFDAVFLLGLEEGTLPRRGAASPFLDDEARGELDHRTAARLTRPDPVERERYLFYTACTRATQRLTLVREAATDEGSPREPSPFWDEVAALFDPDEVRRWTRRRPLSRLTWDLEAAPTERERLRALALLAAREPEDAESIAIANGWERRLRRARGAFTRETTLRHPRVLAELAAKTPFNVTELERFADCSSAWFFERLISPRQIDRKVDAMLRGSVAHTTLHRFYAGLPRAIGSDRVVEASLDDAIAFLGECLEGRAAGRQDGDDRARTPRAGAEPAPRPRAARPRRGALAGAASAAQVRGRVRLRAVGPGAAARSRSRRRDHALRQDRPDRRRPGQRPRHRPGLQVRAHGPLGCRDREGAPAPDSALHARAARSRRDRAAGWALPAAGGRAAAARAAPCRGEGRRASRLRRERLSRRGRVLGAGRGCARPRPRAGAADPNGGRTPRPEGHRRLSGVVRPLADVPDQAGMTTRTPNEQQSAAIAARGQVFVSAGAGTGKTTVLVERFVEAVCERGIDVESMLVITYTERAAGELRGRIRARLHELGRHDLARSLDGAWISTIHGFCLRLLKSHPFAAGLDPRFRVLDDSQGRVIRGEAFEAALNEFCAGDEPDRLQLLATYGAGGLRRMLTTVYETLRSAGRELDLELGERADLQAQLDELAAVARGLADDPERDRRCAQCGGPGGRAR